MSGPTSPLRVAALVKQIPQFEEMRLGPDGRLERDGLPLEMSAYCRRAVAEGVAIARETGGTCTVITLGPPSAEDVLREAIAFGADDGVLVSDPAFAGSDTLATAKALAAVLRRQGPFDLVLTGRASVDADTGQVGPELAELLDLPFATGVKRLVLRLDDPTGPSIDVGLEHDDEWVEANVMLPAVLSAAERLIDPCKVKDPAVWATVDPATITRVAAADLGPGPWGQEASPTRVGETRAERVDRAGIVLHGPVDAQVEKLLAMLDDRGALDPGSPSKARHEIVPPARGDDGPIVAVVIEPERPRPARELLGGAARLAEQLGGPVVAICADVDAADLTSWGADQVVRIERPRSAWVEEDLAAAVRHWAREQQPWAIITGSTAWGREVASRIAAGLGAGLTGDAVGLAVDDGCLVAWKPAFGGSLVAAITASSPIQMVTVRAGVLSLYDPRPAFDAPTTVIPIEPRGRVEVRRRRREDDLGALANAEMVIGVGQGVDPADYHLLNGLRGLLGAEVAATRKVTDQGWMPHARQIGITGQAISPRLYLALGTSGKYNHTVGVRSAGTVVAVNPDPEAPIWSFTDVGIIGDWREVVPELERQLATRRADRHD
jgi:electron transfer flavoprotein alpha subunit